MVMLIIIALWVLAMILDTYYDQSMAVTQEMADNSVQMQEAQE
jgi:nucleoside recognition membrane protein YjiH